jgi:hypothetical protein
MTDRDIRLLGVGFAVALVTVALLDLVWLMYSLKRISRGDPGGVVIEGVVERVEEDG